jgi:hypothetical protein
LNHRRAVRFEERVKKLGGKRGRIDGFFPGLLLVEMKSTGEDLDKAYIQATEYFPGLKDEEMPRCVLVSDFVNLHLYYLESKEPPLKIKLADFPQAIAHFKFIAGYETIVVQQQAAINQRAVEKMAGLHDVIKATGLTEPVLSKVEGAALSRDEGAGKDDAARVAFLFERYRALLES